MLISDHIAALIESMLRERGGTLELKRNDMADRIGCSPSQINYVISSRFSPEHGYLIESRRGGGGYVRITRKSFPDAPSRLAHCFSSIGPYLSREDANAYLAGLLASDAVTPDCAAVMRAALSSVEPGDNARRADLLRRMLLALTE